MRNYWVKILLGALVIFAVGMVGLTLVRNGVGRVKDVVQGSGPISIPLAIIPFELGGNKLGTLTHVVLERTAPKKISSVRLEVKLDDSLVAEGMRGCRLAADIDANRKGGGDVNVKIGEKHDAIFRCMAQGATDTAFVEFGQAVLQPGGVTLPLLLPREMVEELQKGTLDSDSAEVSDSIADAMEALGDSIEEAQDRKADSINQTTASLVDSLRTIGRQRGDSIKRGALRLADSLKAASLKANASRPR